MVPAASPASPCRARSSSAGLIDLVRTREIPSESTVLYAHLGGQPALKRVPLAVALTTEPGIPRSVHLAFLVGARIATVGRTLIASVTGLADAFR